MNALRLVLAVLLPLLVVNAVLWWPINHWAALGWLALVPLAWREMRRSA